MYRSRRLQGLAPPGSRRDPWLHSLWQHTVWSRSLHKLQWHRGASCGPLECREVFQFCWGSLSVRWTSSHGCISEDWRMQSSTEQDYWPLGHHQNQGKKSTIHKLWSQLSASQVPGLLDLLWLSHCSTSSWERHLDCSERAHKCLFWTAGQIPQPPEHCWGWGRLLLAEKLPASPASKGTRSQKELNE